MTAPARMSDVAALLDYHGLDTPVSRPYPLVRRAVVRPAPVIAMPEGTSVRIRDGYIGVRRSDVTYWRGATWT